MPGDSRKVEINRAWARQRREWWRSFLDWYKTQQGCALCGFRSDRGGYFDLDHIDRSAGRNQAVTAMCRKLNPYREDHVERVEAELERVQVLCVACHRDKTAEDLAGDWPGTKRAPL